MHSLPDNTFDLFVTQDVFEHIPEPEKALKEIYRCLKPGGGTTYFYGFHLSVFEIKTANKDGRRKDCSYYGGPVSW